MGSLGFYEEVLNEQGWFIPAYTSIGEIESSIQKLNEGSPLQEAIYEFFTLDKLSIMVSEKYPKTAFVKEYSEIISESVIAHIIGLDHIAVSGLTPAIEGIARKISKDQGVHEKYINPCFLALANHCKEKSYKYNLGDHEEIESMMDSFIFFTCNFLYKRSERYSLEDNTNRHGILHGAYSDDDYGAPINFYKAISAINFMTFISCFLYGGSFYSPRDTESSRETFFKISNV